MASIFASTGDYVVISGDFFLHVEQWKIMLIKHKKFPRVSVNFYNSRLQSEVENFLKRACHIVWAGPTWHEEFHLLNYPTAVPASSCEYYEYFHLLSLPESVTSR